MINALLRNWSVRIGGLMTLIFVAGALISYVWTPFDVETLAIKDKLQTPNGTYWFGTDHFGRDIFSMVMVDAPRR